MKYLILFFAYWILPFSISAQENDENDKDLNQDNHHCLYEKKSLTIAIASPYSLVLSSPGINVRMYYNIGETICFGPEYSYFKTSESELVDLNFVGHYIFETPWVGIYPLAGVNYTVETEFEVHETIADIGLVFGAGVHRNIRNFTAFIEYSRVELGVNDQFFTAGIMYNIK